MGRQTGFENSYRYNRYINSKEWREKANERLKIDNYICCVCGRKATEVHHLTYDNFEHENMEDLASLCHECHEEAENIYNPSVTPQTEFAKGAPKTGEDNFMASMRIDAENISQIVFDYLMKVRGSNFESLWEIRQPTEEGKKDYWIVLRKAVNALCRKRYEMNAEDRKDIAMRMINNHTIANICLDAIFHNNRNFIQASFHDITAGLHETCGTWKNAAMELGISEHQINKLKNDDGLTGGPTLRESVLYYCGLDAVAGIKPTEGFPCLTAEDYQMLNDVANYMIEATGIEFS